MNGVRTASNFPSAIQRALGFFVCLLIAVSSFGTTASANDFAIDPAITPPKVFSNWQALLNSSLTISKVTPAVIKQLNDTRHPRYWNDCFQGATTSSGFKGLTPCHFGDVASKTKVVVVGDSFAGEWIPALDILGKSLHFEVIANVRYGCPFFNLAVRGSLPVDSGCLPFNKAAARFANSLNPSLVIFSQNLYEKRADGSPLDLSGSTYASAISTSISNIHAQAKVMFFGFTFASTDPGICIPRNLNSVQNCSTPLSKTFSTAWFTNFSNAAKTGGAYPIGLSSLSCTASLCPSIVGGQLVHQDKAHFMAGFAQEAAPVLGQLIGCASSQFTSSTVLRLLLQSPTSSASSWCASNAERLGMP